MAARGQSDGGGQEEGPGGHFEGQKVSGEAAGDNGRGRRASLCTLAGEAPKGESPVGRAVEGRVRRGENQWRTGR
eukprot:11186424-Lingulodinium_polyedra.AAC.1